MQERMTIALQKDLSPDLLEIENQSHLHQGHMGDDGSGESHFQVVISSSLFEGQTRVAKERMVHKALGAIMQEIHALSVRIP